MKITAEQAHALRTADTVCFYLRADDTCAIRVSSDRNYLPVDIEVSNYSGVQDYGRVRAEHYVGFASVQNAKNVPEWGTVARRIKAGTLVYLRWVRSNQSPVLDEAGLVRDELSIALVNGGRTDWYKVVVQVGKDNTARMIRIAHPSER